MDRIGTYTLLAIAVLGLLGCSKRERIAQMSEPNVHELVKLFQRGAGCDDIAAEQLQKMGPKGRSQLITMLDDPATPEEDTGAIVMILHVYFPCPESKQAVERLASRSPDPNAREILTKMTQEMTRDPRYK